MDGHAIPLPQIRAVKEYLADPEGAAGAKEPLEQIRQAEQALVRLLELVDASDPVSGWPEGLTSLKRSDARVIAMLDHDLADTVNEGTARAAAWRFVLAQRERGYQQAMAGVGAILTAQATGRCTVDEALDSLVVLSEGLAPVSRKEVALVELARRTMGKPEPEQGNDDSLRAKLAQADAWGKSRAEAAAHWERKFGEAMAQNEAAKQTGYEEGALAERAGTLAALADMREQVTRMRDAAKDTVVSTALYDVLAMLSPAPAPKGSEPAVLRCATGHAMAVNAGTVWEQCITCGEPLTQAAAPEPPAAPLEPEAGEVERWKLKYEEQVALRRSSDVGHAWEVAHLRKSWAQAVGLTFDERVMPSRAELEAATAKAIAAALLGAGAEAYRTHVRTYGAPDGYEFHLVENRGPRHVVIREVNDHGEGVGIWAHVYENLAHGWAREPAHRSALEWASIMLGLDAPAPSAPQGGPAEGFTSADALADEVEGMVFAFATDDDRRDAVRRLAARVRALRPASPPHGEPGPIGDPERDPLTPPRGIKATGARWERAIAAGRLASKDDSRSLAVLDYIEQLMLGHETPRPPHGERPEPADPEKVELLKQEWADGLAGRDDVQDGPGSSEVTVRPLAPDPAETLASIIDQDLPKVSQARARDALTALTKRIDLATHDRLTAAAALPRTPAEPEPTDDEQRAHALDLLTWAAETAAAGLPEVDRGRVQWAAAWFRHEDADRDRYRARVLAEGEDLRGHPWERMLKRAGGPVGDVLREVVAPAVAELAARSGVGPVVNARQLAMMMHCVGGRLRGHRNYYVAPTEGPDYEAWTALVARDLAERESASPNIFRLTTSGFVFLFGMDRAALEPEDDELDPITPDMLHDMLSLVMDGKHPTVETIAGWTDSERAEAERWAAHEHLIASDHTDVERLPKPAWLREETGL